MVGGSQVLVLLVKIIKRKKHAKRLQKKECMQNAQPLGVKTSPRHLDHLHAQIFSHRYIHIYIYVVSYLVFFFSGVQKGETRLMSN